MKTTETKYVLMNELGEVLARNDTWKDLDSIDSWWVHFFEAYEGAERVLTWAADYVNDGDTRPGRAARTIMEAGPRIVEVQVEISYNFLSESNDA